jgi:hypothetical protein
MPGHPWPLFDLRIKTPHLELRLPTDDDLLGLMAVARAGVADPDRSVFLVPWHLLPSPAFERQFLLHWWSRRGGWDPTRCSRDLSGRRACDPPATTPPEICRRRPRA